MLALVYNTTSYGNCPSRRYPRPRRERRVVNTHGKSFIFLSHSFLFFFLELQILDLKQWFGGKKKDIERRKEEKKKKGKLIFIYFF